jgi:hypothetical protein
MNQPATRVSGEPTSAASVSADAQLVINLCSSTTPMSLVKPAFKELERFTFFVSRRREDGRERFRLHMGYFPGRAEAEQWLAVVRSVYPGAWISEAPGKKLRENQANQAPQVTPVARPAAAPPAATVAPRAPVLAPTNKVAAGNVTAPAVAPAAPVARVAPTSVAAKSQPNAAVQPNRAVPSVKPVAPEPSAAAAPPPASHDAAPHSLGPIAADLTDSQVMRVLDHVPTPDDAAAAIAASVPMVNKIDPYSLQALRTDLKQNLPVSFAVQLEWTAKPIDITKIPPLAIFRAYTLYTVGTQYDGRKWFGLRLGFFSDALSAKQVAQYVRSEFVSVAVVPVSTRERAQADATGGIDVESTSPVRHTPHEQTEEITLLPDGQKPAAPSKEAVSAMAKAAVALAQANAQGNNHAASAVNKVPTAANKPAGRATALRTKATVIERGAARTGKPRTLEETLEILGASQLTIDNGRGERLNINGRKARVSPKTSTFTKLLDRLADKLRS